MAHQQLKRLVAESLRSPDWPRSLNQLVSMPARQVVNPLFGLLYHGDPLIRWRAVTAMGAVVSNLADAQMESARIIMRRFMWNLNDESGGIGWGSPEAMGEIMARHEGLAREYAAILVSYANPEGNFLEHPGLQQGVLWALGRLGRVRPELVVQAADFIKPFLQSSDRALRGLAVWALQSLPVPVAGSLLESLRQDDQAVVIYAGEQLQTCIIGQLAADFLSERMEPGQ